MSLFLHGINYKDAKTLQTELEFIVACNKVEGKELIKLSLLNEEALLRFKNAATRILKNMKRDGVIKLFLFENEFSSEEKMETIYMMNKFPFLFESEEPRSESSLYIKI